MRTLLGLGAKLDLLWNPGLPSSLSVRTPVLRQIQAAIQEGEASGAEKQRIVIAMVLAQYAHILPLDQSTVHLDVTIRWRAWS
jgi:ABC-type glutathione transport system ATPase component